MEKGFIGKGKAAWMRLLKDQIPEEQAANSPKPGMQDWFNVNETQSRLKNLILICINLFLPLLEKFGRVTRLYHGVKMEIDLVKPG